MENERQSPVLIRDVNVPSSALPGVDSVLQLRGVSLRTGHYITGRAESRIRFSLIARPLFSNDLLTFDLSGRR
jgi:hypothetical protein